MELSNQDPFHPLQKEVGASLHIETLTFKWPVLKGLLVKRTCTFVWLKRVSFRQESVNSSLLLPSEAHLKSIVVCRKV